LAPVTVTVPVRVDAPGFASTEKVTTPPLPVPEVPAVMWRKLELVEAVQLHPGVVMTVKLIPVVTPEPTPELEVLNE